MHAEDDVVGRRRPGAVVWIGLAVGVIAAAVAALVWAGGSDESRPTRQGGATTTQPGEATTSSTAVNPIQELSGTGDKTSDAFTVAENWEIRWRSTAGKAFAIELLGKNGGSRGEIVRAGDRAEGSTFVSEAGEFKLKVTASGDWSIQLFGREQE